jgi:hypothetical protein
MPVFFLAEIVNNDGHFLHAITISGAEKDEKVHLVKELWQ